MAWEAALGFVGFAAPQLPGTVYFLGDSILLGEVNLLQVAILIVAFVGCGAVGASLGQLLGRRGHAGHLERREDAA